MNQPMSQPMRACPPADPHPRRPKAPLPAGTCDTHAHLFGPEALYPWSPQRGYTPPEALPAAYERLHAILGVSRGVLTQPSVYGTDNRAMLDYVRAHPGRMRAIVAVGPDVSDRELEAMHAAGARGIRVNLVDPGGNPFRSFAGLHRVAERIRPLGWHVELLIHVHEMDATVADLKRLAVDFSIGHFGYMPARLGVQHAKYRAFLDLVADGRCWVKLSGPYRITARRAAPYDDVTPFAHALVARRPDRIVWGTDWPHPIVPVPMPNDGDLADHVFDWLPDETLRRRVLVDNPARLYGFPE